MAVYRFEPKLAGISADSLSIDSSPIPFCLHLDHWSQEQREFQLSQEVNDVVGLSLARRSTKNHSKPK